MTNQDYYTALALALRRAGVGGPVLVIDRARLLGNIAAAKDLLAGTGLAVRVVVKSLPCLRLIDTVTQEFSTQRLMLFSTAMLGEITLHRPKADVLMGKPVTAVAAAAYYDACPQAAPPQWLIDTQERLQQFAELTAARGLKLRANLEIDVGLHRGGFANPQALSGALDLAALHPHVEISGLMGYDPHVAKVPDRARSFDRSQAAYRAARTQLEAALPGDPARFTYNSAGSPTFALHAKGTAANEVSIGSAFVKPGDFDLDTLTRFAPALCIATPVLKALPRALMPSFEWLAGVMAVFGRSREKAFFIHGGHWLAQPVYPPGLKYSKLYGRSSNQEMLTGAHSTPLAPDDLVFLRPSQSEAVLLQFGDLLIFTDGEITDRWPVFPVSA